MEHSSHAQHARVAVLFAALTAAFFTYVHQVDVLGREANAFQANMLERSTAVETELSEVSLTADVLTPKRRITAVKSRAQSRAILMARRRARASSMHTAAPTNKQ